MKPRSRYIAHSSSFTHERRSSRARCSARRSRPGSPRSRSSRRRRALRGLRCARCRSNARIATGAARPAATIASTRSASTTVRSAPRRPWEEDPPLGLRRDLGVRLPHPPLTPPALRPRFGHRPPHALVELAPELLHEPLLVLAHRRITLTEEDFATTRLHTEELH